MLHKKRDHPKEKIVLHQRNKHRGRYDFKQLSESTPELAPFVKMNSYDDESINFSDPQAVRILNKALLKYFYGLDHCNIPSGYLCPPIPGRADYIHYVADLLTDSRNGNIPTGSSVKCLDIGTGSSCVYPLIGTTEYGWTFVGTDIDPGSLESANKIVALNPVLDGKIELRLQMNSGDIFYGIIRPDEHFDLTICNPPFRSSAEESQSGSLRKLKNLKLRKIANPVLNFGGQGNELWCEGGELQFVQNMIKQSRHFASSCLWFTTLISKESNLKKVEEMLKKAETVRIKIIPMGQGNKISRIVAWTFLTDAQQKLWSHA